MFRTASGKMIEMDQIVKELKSFYEKNKAYGTPFQVIVGSDSQNFSETHLATVICILCEGHGGRYFYSLKATERKLTTVRQKLHAETNESLMVADSLLMELEKAENTELKKNCPIAIHIDAGNSEKGKTKPLIPEIVGWVKACGYASCWTKPYSVVASTLADKMARKHIA